MDRQQAQMIVDGLHAAETAGAVEELVGQSARDFAFVRDEVTRPDLLGTFRVKADKEFFVSVASRAGGDFGLMVYERRKGPPVLATRMMGDDGVIWRYQATKWTGDNEARKRAFFEAAKAPSVTFPLPRSDIGDFSAAINRAIELRRLADAAGGGEDENATWQPPAPVLPPRSKLPPTRLGNHTVPGVVWQLCASGPGATLDQIQQAIDDLGLDGSHPATKMLARYATHHGCAVAAHGAGIHATYTLTAPNVTPVAVQEDSGPDFEDILDQLRGESLSFSAELVASYLLALQAKRFVLLTGISGTGKTKLAQEIAEAFGVPGVDVAGTADDRLPDEFVVRVQPSHRDYARFIVPAPLAREFEALADPEIKQLDLQLPGQPRTPMTLSKRADNSSLLEVLLRGKTREWFMTNLQVGDRFALSKHVEGEEEWLELRPLPRAARPARPTGARCELIAVRPDWTDKNAILGFFNPLTQRYQSTPILQLLLRAIDEVTTSSDTSPPRPYFLIFDEMNLARVEHYFSDFLSAMESGDAIHLHDEELIEDRDGKQIPRRLTLPPNLFVIGTVNIDETTHMFSPKVLDRAFVLEFNDVNFDGIGRTIEEKEATSTPLALQNFERLSLRGKATNEEWQAFERVLDGEAIAVMRAIHDVLAVEHRHFGYRVAREIARFVDLAREQTDGQPEALRAAFDVAVLAKVFPKLHGSQGELEETLKRLLAIAMGAKAGTEVVSNDGKWLLDLAAAPMPRSARKLERMLRRLRARGFVSFIE